MTETCSMDMLPDASMYCSTVALSPFRASPRYVLYVAGGFFAPCACVPLKESRMRGGGARGILGCPLPDPRLPFTLLESRRASPPHRL